MRDFLHLPLVVYQRLQLHMSCLKSQMFCATITVTPCWCYGSETMDMSPDIPHAIWGFNGTERPGAVYLAAVLASHARKGFQRLVFMVEMFRKLMIQIFQKMSEKNFYVMRAQLLQLA